MATLAAQIEADLQILHPAEQLKDWTNRRSLTATGSLTIDAANLTRTCQIVAAEITRKLGDVDGDDIEAVGLGCELAVAKYLNPQGAGLDGYDTNLAAIERRIKDSANSRRAEIGPDQTPVSFDKLNNRFPGEDWEPI